MYLLYREEGLCLKRKRPKRRRMAVARQARPAAAAPNQRWAMDFMSDALHDGRKLRVLTVVDTCTRERVALEARGMFRSEDVAAVLTRVGLERGLPAAIAVDNGTEFTARAMDHWAYTHRVELDYSRPGKPTDNAFVEAFNSLVRRECLSQHYFSSLEEARQVLEAWREEYNNHRPHGSLGDRTPAEYRAGGHHVPDRNRLLVLRA